MNADKLAAIRKKAETLAGRELGERGDLLTEIAAHRACAYCQRGDIPEEMEQAVAALVVTLAEGEGGLKTISRGDTTVTYAAGPEASALSGLLPFRRLGALKEE